MPLAEKAYPFNRRSAKRSSKGEPSTSLAKKPRVVDDPLGNPREHQLPDAAGKNPKGQDDDQASEKSGGEGDVPESSDGKSTGEVSSVSDLSFSPSVLAHPLR